MEIINLKKHKKKFDLNRKSLRYFLTRTENKPPADLDFHLEKADKEVWANVDCLGCANCCKVMSPTYTFQDIKRISAHLGMRPKDFKEKWLYLDKRDNDWMNKSQPCQFLDLKSNMCSIYEVRPADCAGFPHFLKKPTADYFYVHKQNIEYCPATMMLVEKLKANVEEGSKTKSHVQGVPLQIP
jgi:Fe-S-cluster containining protein